MTHVNGVYTVDDQAVRARPGAFQQFTCAWCGAVRYTKLHNPRRTCSRECARQHHDANNRRTTMEWYYKRKAAGLPTKNVTGARYETLRDL